MTLAAVAILVIVLAASDKRVRDQVSGRGRGGSSAQVGTVVARARSTAHTAGGVARAVAGTHTILVTFTIAGAVLVVLMLRT